MVSKTHDRFTIAVALRKSLKKGYNFHTLRADATAGLIVSLVALPLAMALSIAVGLPPQYGLYTAIIAGIIVPLLGGSIYQVSGPTAAFVVILAPIVSQYGLRGLIITTIIAGFLLIFLGMVKLGRFINYMPYPVIVGFTSGIAVVIGTLALNDFLGLDIKKLQGEYIEKVKLIIEHIPTLKWQEALVGISSLSLMFISKRIFSKIPSPVVGIGIGTLLAFYLQHNGFDIATIGNRYSFILPDGTTGQGIPQFAPSFHILGLDKSELFAWPSFQEIKTLMAPALVITTLGALESLLSASAADGMSGTKHHPNSELIGIGIGNILTGLAGGIPATGAIARTSTNILSGAKTPLASSIHGIFIMLYVLLLAPYMSYIPMASLAALLITVAYRMSHWQQFIRIVMIAPRSDTIVLITCFAFTIFIDMVAGVTAGVVLACLLLIKRMTNLTRSEISHVSTSYHSKISHLKLPQDMMIYHITGPVFFGTMEIVFDRIRFIQDQIKTIIIDMENVPFIDITGLVAMKNIIMDTQNNNISIILCGKGEITDKIIQKLTFSSKNKVRVFETMEQVVKVIENYVKSYE